MELLSTLFVNIAVKLLQKNDWLTKKAFSKFFAVEPTKRFFNLKTFAVLACFGTKLDACSNNGFNLRSISDHINYPLYCINMVPLEEKKNR